VTPASTDYPRQNVEILPFPDDLAELFPRPIGFLDNWPPPQITYLGLYLGTLGCKCVVRESHYIDRDYILDHAVFYSRSLRNYPNYCKRLHFFSQALTEGQWRRFYLNAKGPNPQKTTQKLQKTYLGFVVVKPLPGSPIGRTVLKTYAETSTAGNRRFFGGVRKYMANTGGFSLAVEGLAFQQQDRGVSACATTALWSSLHKVAHEERLSVPTPSQITESATRYSLPEGRSLPSEGLDIQQISEAIRGTGLQPLVIRAVSPEQDRAQIVAYVKSGFPPVLAIRSQKTGGGHAVCVVGIKMGDVYSHAPPAEHPHHWLASNALQGLYVHDDRLGPYASAGVTGWTLKDNQIVTAVQIEWPDKTYSELSLVMAFIVPVPDKIRMPIARVLASGAVVAELAGIYFKEFKRRVVLDTFYKTGVAYRKDAFNFGLTDVGLYSLCCETTLPRFLAVIEISAREGPLFDVLIDSTETRFNPSALLFVKRAAFPARYVPALEHLAEQFGARLIY
jgi:hypothetical protein